MLKGDYFLPLKTVHTARTIMLDEISKVMYSMDSTMVGSAVLNDNIFNKQTQKNLQRTNAALKKLYLLRNDFPPFMCFHYFWHFAPETEKPLLTFLFALGMDYLIYDVSETVINLKTSSEITSSRFAEIITNLHYDKLAPSTIASASRNLISSFRQAGLLKGTGINTKSNPIIGNTTFAFACLMAYFNDDRGEFILQSKWIKILGIDSTELRDLAGEASLKGLMEFKYAGNVVTISFNNLFTKLGLYGFEN